MSDEDREQKLGAYAPPPEDYETFDARDSETERRGPILLFAAVAVLVLFAALVWNAYRLGVRERDAAPVILAEEEPYRQRPADPGGYETPGQDIEAYTLREGPGAGEAEAESGTAGLRPGPEEPVANTPAPADTEMPPLRVETVDADAVDEPDIEAGPDTEREPARSEPAPTLEDTPPQPAREPVAEPASQTAPVPVTGDYVVQIAAFRSRAEAEQAWVAFTERFPDLAQGRRLNIIEADLGERGIYYRLRIAAFESRDAARAYCTTLSARGQDCLVAQR